MQLWHPTPPAPPTTPLSPLPAPMHTFFPCICDWTTWADHWWVTIVYPISPNVTQIAHLISVWFSSDSRGLLWFRGTQIKKKHWGFDLKGWGSTFQRHGGCVRASWNGSREATRMMCGKESQHECKERLTKHWWTWACAFLYRWKAVVPGER